MKSILNKIIDYRTSLTNRTHFFGMGILWKPVVSLCLLFCTIVAFGAYVSFMVGTTVSAAERRELLALSADLTAEISKKEAVYVKLMEHVDRESAIALGFVPVDPSFVAKGSLGADFSFEKKW